MIRVNPYWADFFRESFISNIDLYSDCLAERTLHTLIPSFALSDPASHVVVSHEDAFHEYLSRVFIVMQIIQIIHEHRQK